MLHLTGTPFAIAPNGHYSGRASDLVQRKVDSVEGFSNVDSFALIALVVIRSFAAPTRVTDSNQENLIDSDSQMQTLASDYSVVVHQILVRRMLPYLHNQVACQTAALHTLVDDHTVDHSSSNGLQTVVLHILAGFHIVEHH